MTNNLDRKELPEIVQQYIKSLARSVRNRHMRQDVLAELGNHFADALADVPQDSDREELAASLVSEFGDTKLLAKLIKRAKRRCYPIWLKVVGYTCRTIIIAFLISFAYTTWFLSGKPTVSVDYVAKFNEMVRPVADGSLNAAPYYLKAAELYVEPEDKDDFVEFQELLGYITKPQEPKALTKWLQANRPAIQELRLGTAKPYCWFKYDVAPHSQRRIHSIMGPLSVLNSKGWYPISVVLFWQMQFAAEQGDWNSFAADLKSAKTLARHLLQCPISTERFEGMFIDQWAHKQLIQALQGYSLPPSALQRLAQSLDESFPSGYPITNMSIETLGLLDAAQRLFTDNGPGDGHFIPSPAGGFFSTGTIDNTRGYYYPSANDPYFVAWAMIHPSRRQTVAIIEQWKQMQDSYRSTTPYQDYIAGHPFDDWFMKTIKENPRNLFIKNLLPNMQGVVLESYAGKAKHEAVQTIIALLRYKADHGQFPETLDELAPQYLKTIPQDPFGPGPLTYKKQGDDFILYSWGLNFEDNSGQHNEMAFRKEKESGDYVFWPPWPPQAVE